MRISKGIRATAKAAALAAAAASLSACLGPTYGTDKSSTEQLVDDISNIATIKPDRGPTIDYKPRPALVRPPETANLPQPQQSVAAENPNWVESPEDSRKRLVAEADASGNDFAYRSPLARRDKSTGRATAKPSASSGSPSPLSVMRQESANRSLRENLKIQKGAYSDRRRFLSDPPLDYRKPAETAAVGELGEPEKQKERERIAAATKKKGFQLPKFSLPW
ncbi:hypothetical protein E2A64_05080 [Pseudohoeflea suaedae]|uniref:DUF3035 domain-containing protein n=1 Tax=Pseudohoeflea suaedae TaxID=877384 RepID=A0A4R5PNR9_9HYPH|nr:hypothetical protein [Pseudohoeflea suaedae]TDH38483.1 hypothetical protein E2A64_05080 [Pseudohoeflea suaedae]